MLLEHIDKIIVVQGKAWTGIVHEHSAQPDNSVELLKKYFPQVQILEDKTNDFSSELYNQALPYLQDYDFVTRFDTDFFFTQQDLKRFYDFISEPSIYKCFRLNFATSSINYYLDLNHGAKDARELDPVAINPKIPFDGLIEHAGPALTIDWTDWTLHHLKQVGKNTKLVRRWMNGEMPYPFTTSPEEISNGKWIEAPLEIKERLNKWSKIAPIPDYEY